MKKLITLEPHELENLCSVLFLSGETYAREEAMTYARNTKSCDMSSVFKAVHHTNKKNESKALKEAIKRFDFKSKENHDGTHARKCFPVKEPKAVANICNECESVLRSFDKYCPGCGAEVVR